MLQHKNSQVATARRMEDDLNQGLLMDLRGQDEISEGFGMFSERRILYNEVVLFF